MSESAETTLVLDQQCRQKMNLDTQDITPLPCIKDTSVKPDGLKRCNNNQIQCPEVGSRLKLPDEPNCSDSRERGDETIKINGVVDGKSMGSEPLNGFPLNSSDNDGNNDQSVANHSTSTTSTINCESDLLIGSTTTSNVSEMSPLSGSDLVIECDDARNPDNSNSNTYNPGDVENLIGGLETTSLQDKPTSGERDIIDGITYVVYESEKQMPDIMRLITKDLSEPYSIYTYRYFIHNWPKLCFLAMDGDICIGAIVCKLDLHKKMVRRGYIAMLAVDSSYRRRKLGSTLVTKAIKAMIRDDCDEVVLETEITNQAALRLYENLGFVRDKRLFRYYLNGVDALRLKLWLR